MIILEKTEYFDIGQICNSGQCFRMQKIEGCAGSAYQVIARDQYVRVYQNGDRVALDCTQEDFEKFWKVYFDLDADYGAYIARIDPKDEYLNAAAKMGGGIRILHQDLWEMIVSFLISQQNNIVRIRRCIDHICRRYGEEKAIPGMETEEKEISGALSGAYKVWSAQDEGWAEHTAENCRKTYDAFPTPEALAGATEEELRECNLGYRAKYVLRTAQAVASGMVSLEAISGMDYPDAREALLELYGVGEKVADCICLFALHHLEAFPVDTHIRQALDGHYRRGFPWQRYKGIQGVMQQYIFYRELM